MKSLLPLLTSIAILLPWKSKAAFGIFESYVIINNTYYDLFASTGNTDFSGANLGTFVAGSTLTFNGGQIKTFKESNGGCPGGNVCGGSIHWSVTGGSSGQNTLNYNSSYGNQSSGCSVNQQWDNTGGSSNILSGLSAGTYTISVYCRATGHQNNNGACDQSVQQGALEATFTITAPAPVALIDFTWRKAGKRSILLQWRTASERNNERFEVERSADALQWESIAQVSSLNGNSNREQAYSWLDATALSPRSYYRLRQVDQDGKSSLSPVLTAQVGTQSTVRLYPNPLQENTTNLYVEETGDTHQLRLFTANGQLLREWRIEPGQDNTYTLDLRAAPSGLLFLEVDGVQLPVIK